MLDNEELLFDELYEKTKNCGRTQFIKLLMRKERQQKEFINYLEKKLNFYKINTQGYSMNLVEEILQKYKSIIGGNKDE